MGDRKISFAELPGIDNVPIQDENMGTNASEIIEQLFGFTTICAQVNIRKYSYVKGTFFHVGGFSKIEIAYYFNFMTILRICGFYVNKPLSIGQLNLQ
jgi:hypothetical protein